MGRDSAPDDDGDLLVAPVRETPPRPRPRRGMPSCRVPSSRPTSTNLKLVERVRGPRPRVTLVDAVIVEDYALLARVLLAPTGEGVLAENCSASARAGSGAGTQCLCGVQAAYALAVLICGVLCAEPFAAPAAASRYCSCRSSSYTTRARRDQLCGRLLFGPGSPRIVAGVLFGAQLDAAHKGRHALRTRDETVVRGAVRVERPGDMVDRGWVKVARSVPGVLVVGHSRAEGLDRNRSRGVSLDQRWNDLCVGRSSAPVLLAELSRVDRYLSGSGRHGPARRAGDLVADAGEHRFAVKLSWPGSTHAADGCLVTRLMLGRGEKVVRPDPSARLPPCR